MKTITDDFVIGSFVLVSYPDNSLGKGRPPHKFMKPQRGPFEIVTRQCGIFSFRDLATNVVAPYNAHLLRPYNYDLEHDNTRDVALHEKQEFDVESILSHDGDLNKTSSLIFLVKWKDYDQSHNSWEPWKELRDNPALFKYFRDRKLERFIPRKHR